MRSKLKIGLSYSDHRIEEYRDYLNSTKYEVDIIDLSYHNNNVKDIEKCHALVLSGGIDINPSLYGKNNKKDLCGNIVDKRDEFEVELIDSALNQYIPMFGICRGMQMINVSPSLKGSMICDIDTEHSFEGKKILHRNELKEGASHKIQIVKDSLLYKILGTGEVEVNSFHHQAVEKTGQGLKVSSFSNDRIPESLEWEEEEIEPFLLLVQWHPERMTDFSSKKILEYFYGQV